MFFFSLMISCIDPVEIDISTDEGKLVVYGIITNEKVAQSIKLYRSTSFQNPNAYPSVSDAEVYLLDRLDARIEFLEEGDSGTYFAPDDFEVLPGDAFELHVITKEGEHVVSTTETVRSLPPAISVSTVAILSPEEFEVDPLVDNYYVSALIDDEKGINNYYRWKIYVNGELRETASEMILFDDRISDGILFRYSATNVLFKENDVVSLRYYSLTATAYRFFQLLQGQTEHNALETSAPRPVSIESNLINVNDEKQVILGLFSVAEVETIEGINF